MMPPLKEPGFLLLAIKGADHPKARTSGLASAVEIAGGTLLARGDAAENAYLEVGTPPKSVLLALWPSEAAVTAAWEKIKRAPGLDDLDDTVTALAGTCLSQTGLPDLPTLENTAKILSAGPPAFMLIEGTMSEPEAMGRYRDIIFPMIRERGGYYVIYTAAAGVNVLNGEWAEQALILSRWPDQGAAKDFWYSDRYQQLAIPTRANAGRFSVILLPVSRSSQ